jgi:hypothetical protein
MLPNLRQGKKERQCPNLSSWLVEQAAGHAAGQAAGAFLIADATDSHIYVEEAQ